MTTLLHETWEGGTNAAACTTSNTAFGRLITRWTFDNTHVPTGQGSLSGKVAVSAQTAQAQGDVTASDRGYVELWVWAAALPTSDTTIASFLTAGAAAVVAEVRLKTDGTLMIRNSGHTAIANTGTGAFHTSQWMKLQWLYDNAAGQQRLRVFWTNTASNTPDYDSSLVSTTAAGQIGTFQVGVVNSTTWTAWFGDVTVDDTAWPTVGGGGSGGTVTHRASTSATATDSAHTIAVTVPASVAAGDVMVLSFGAGQQTTQTPPTGWTSLAISQSATNITLDVWQKTAVAGDASSAVTVTSDNTVSFTRQLHLSAFTGGKVGARASRLETASTAAHSTPQVSAVDPAAWLLQGCMDRGNPSSTGFTLPSNLTQRTLQTSVAGGGVSSVTATGASVGSGSVGANTITGTQATAKAATWTVTIEPTTATSPLTASAGPDVFVEPWRTLTITPTASATPDSWSWAQASPPSPATDITSGATVDANGTIHLTAPAATGLVQYTLRVTAHKAGSTDATDAVVVSVYPATRWFVRSDGRVVPIRYQKVT